MRMYKNRRGVMVTQKQEFPLKSTLLGSTSPLAKDLTLILNFSNSFDYALVLELNLQFIMKNSILSCFPDELLNYKY